MLCSIRSCLFSRKETMDIVIACVADPLFCPYCGSAGQQIEAPLAHWEDSSLGRLFWVPLLFPLGSQKNVWLTQCEAESEHVLWCSLGLGHGFVARTRGSRRRSVPRCDGFSGFIPVLQARWPHTGDPTRFTGCCYLGTWQDTCLLELPSIPC